MKNKSGIFICPWAYFPGFLMALILFVLLACGAKKKQHFWFGMDTNFSVTLYGNRGISPEQAFLLLEQETRRLEGIFNDYQSDRQTAKLIGQEHSNGNARIDRYNRFPLVRMSNLYLEPDPQRKILFLTTEGGSIDFEGTIYTHGETTNVSNGEYNITAIPDEYYSFNHWSLYLFSSLLW